VTCQPARACALAAHEAWLLAKSSEASAEDAIGCKRFSHKLSLILNTKEISKLGHVGDELRKGDIVVASPFVTLAAYSVFCTGRLRQDTASIHR
jgi:hypothetical protein